MGKVAGAAATVPAVREDLRRIGEHDPDFVRLKVRTVRQLVRSVGQLVGALRRGGGDATATHQAVSDFLARHIAILQAAYEAGHREGARDYYGATSLRSARYAANVKPDRQTTQKRMAFYALPSVTRMAVEAQSALHATQLAKVVIAHENRESVVLLAGGDSSGAGGDALAQWQDSLGARITLQADVVWSGLQDGYTEAGGGDPAYGYYSLIYWLLEPLATHCDDCLEMGADSPYNAPGLGGNTLYTTPGDGSTECGAACKCSLSYDAPGQIQDRLNDALAEALARAGQGDLATQLRQSNVPNAPAALSPPAAPVGPQGEQLSESQKGALDAYREAADAWDLVRDNLPSFRDILSGELHDAPVIAAGTELTPEQAKVVERLVRALVRFAGEDAEDEGALREALVQAQTRLEAAQQRVDDINARLAARPSDDFISREEMHAANVEYVTAQQAVEDAAAALGKTPEEIRELVGDDGVYRPAGSGNGGASGTGGSSNSGLAVDSAVVADLRAKIAAGVTGDLSDTLALGIAAREGILNAIRPQYEAMIERARILQAHMATGQPATGDDAAWIRGDPAAVAAHGGIHFLEADQEFREAFQAQARALLGELRDVGGVTVSFVDSSDPAYDAKAAEFIQRAADVLPRDWIDAAVRRGDLTPARDRGRNTSGYYEIDRASGGGRIAVRYTTLTEDDTLLTTAIHEWGHRVEDVLHAISEIETEYYGFRTTGETAVPLSNGLRWMTKRDRWFDEYVGRTPYFYARDPSLGILGGFGYEILSMGLEMLLGPDAVVWQAVAADPGFFAFVLGVLLAY